MVRKTAMLSNPANTWLARISKISTTFDSCFLLHPQPHESNLTRAVLEKGGGGGSIITNVEPMIVLARVRGLQQQA